MQLSWFVCTIIPEVKFAQELTNELATIRHCLND